MTPMAQKENSKASSSERDFDFLIGTLGTGALG